MVSNDKMQEIVYNANSKVVDKLHSYSLDNPYVFSCSTLASASGGYRVPAVTM